jgi:hypothetical protein
MEVDIGFECSLKVWSRLGCFWRLGEGEGD